MIHNQRTLDASQPGRPIVTRSIWRLFALHLVLASLGVVDVWGHVAAAELRSAQAASFRIIAGSSGGSGTAIAEHLVVTNAHVVATSNGAVFNGDVRVFQPLTGREHVGRVLASNPAVDVALVHVPDAVLPCVPVSPTGPQIGAPAHMIGYGGDAVMKVGSGEFVSNRNERAPGVAVWFCNVQSISGDSGGGVFDDAGELVAINWGGETDSTASASTASPHILKVCLAAATHFKVEPTQCFGGSFGRCQQQPGGGGGYGVQPKVPVQPFAPLVDVPPLRPAQPPVTQPPITQPPAVGCEGKCADGIAGNLAELSAQLIALRAEQITREDVLAITIEQRDKLRDEITEDVRRRIGPTPAYFEIRKRGN